MADVLDLDQLGEPVQAPGTEAEDAFRTRRADRLPEGALGRVRDLALWWAGVRGDDRAGPPAGVVHVGATGPLEPARASGPVRRLPLDPPDDVPGALEWGVALADRIADGGGDLLLLTAPDGLHSRAVTAELMGLDAVEAAGWPTARGLTDEEWMDEVAAVRDLLHRTRGLRGKPTALLEALGSGRTAGATALVLQATARRTPVLLDGPGACAAALIARRTARSANTWWQVAQRGGDPLHGRMLTSLDLHPLTDLGVEIEDGTAAVLALAVLDVAAHLLTAELPTRDEA